MNRRQFLTGASAIAVSAALPAAPAAPDWSLDCFAIDGIKPVLHKTIFLRQVFYGGKCYWITGEDNVIHWLDPRDVEITG